MYWGFLCPNTPFSSLILNSYKARTLRERIDLMSNWNFEPKKWNEVFGQEHIKPYILSAIKAGNFPKFSIFSGKPGVGKSVTSELVGRTICCENSDEEPCGICKNCREPLGGAVKKFNMGKYSKREINEIVSEIFDYKSMREQQVYILEEMHAIRSEDQIVFLEELTKIPDDVYIIVCTTQLYKLIPELRDRGIIFNFEPLTSKECLLYANFLCNRIGIEVDNESLKYLCEICENIPRQILKLLEFFSNSKEISKQTLMEFLGIVEDQEVEQVLKALVSVKDVVALSEFLQSVNSVKVAKRLREYLVTELFKRGSAFQLYGESKFLKLIEFTCDQLDKGLPQSDSMACLFFIRLYLLLNGVDKPNKELVVHNDENSAIQSVRANAKTPPDLKSEEEIVPIGNLSMEDLQALGGYGTVFVEETNEFGEGR